MKYYAVKYTDKDNKINRVVTSWDECKTLVNGYKAIYKSFESLEEAESYNHSIKNEDIKKILAKREAGYKKAKYVQVGISLNKDIYHKFEAQAQKHSITTAEIIEKYINIISNKIN